MTSVVLHARWQGNPWIASGYGGGGGGAGGSGSGILDLAFLGCFFGVVFTGNHSRHSSIGQVKFETCRSSKTQP